MPAPPVIDVEGLTVTYGDFTAVRDLSFHVQQGEPADTGVPSLDAVIATALAEDRAERFRSAQAFRAALRSATGAWPTTTR